MKRFLAVLVALSVASGLYAQAVVNHVKTPTDFDAAVNFRSTVTATGGFTGPTTGAVTGNVTGDVTGNVTGNLTGGLISPVTVGNGTLVFGQKTLTEAGGAEILFTLTTATTQTTGGTLEYTVRIVDSAGSPDYSIRTGHLQFNMSNSGGTTICTGDASAQTDDDSFLTQQGTAKTNTYAITFVTGTNTCAVKFNIDSDIATVTSASATWVLRLNGPGTVS